MISERRNTPEKLVRGLLAVVIWLSSSVLGAEEPRDTDIQISREKIAEARFDRFTGIMRINSSMEAMNNLVSDIDSYSSWLYGCEEVKILKGDREGQARYIYFIYSAPELPWYLFMAPKPKRRNMVLKMEQEEDPATGKLIVKLVSVDPQKETDLEGVEIPSDPDLVTVTEIVVSWEFNPGEDNTVTVTHALYIDPNHKGEDLGIINKFAKKLVEKSLENVRDLFHTP